MEVFTILTTRGTKNWGLSRVFRQFLEELSEKSLQSPKIEVPQVEEMSKEALFRRPI